MLYVLLVSACVSLKLHHQSGTSDILQILANTGNATEQSAQCFKYGCMSFPNPWLNVCCQFCASHARCKAIWEKSRRKGKSKCTPIGSVQIKTDTMLNTQTACRAGLSKDGEYMAEHLASKIKLYMMTSTDITKAKPLCVEKTQKFPQFTCITERFVPLPCADSPSIAACAKLRDESQNAAKQAGNPLVGKVCGDELAKQCVSTCGCNGIFQKVYSYKFDTEWKRVEIAAKDYENCFKKDKLKELTYRGMPTHGEDSMMVGREMRTCWDSGLTLRGSVSVQNFASPKSVEMSYSTLISLDA